MLLTYIFNLQVIHLYICQYIHKLQMNIKTTSKLLAVLTAMIALTSMGVSTVSAHTPTIFQYGTIAQEDQDFAVHDGAVYLNAIYEDNSGNFRYAMTAELTIDEALDRFYPDIQEDTNQFTIYKDWNNLGMIFQYNDETQTFQFIGVSQ